MHLYKIEGTANPFDVISKVLYQILHLRHFDRIMGCYGSPHDTHLSFRPNPDDNSSSV
jgi:hypothetical protein